MSAVTIEHPKTDEVAQLMHGLFGLKVSSTDAPDAAVHSIAQYNDDSGNPVGYIGVDLAGGCRLGCALTMIPAGRADEAVGEGNIPESLAENLAEILNIASNLVKAADGRVILARCAHGSADAQFGELKEAMDALNSVDFGIDVERYGTVRITVAV